MAIPAIPALRSTRTPRGATPYQALMKSNLRRAYLVEGARLLREEGGHATTALGLGATGIALTLEHLLHLEDSVLALEKLFAQRLIAVVGQEWGDR